MFNSKNENKQLTEKDFELETEINSSTDENEKLVDWMEEDYEGQLSVDVYHTDDEIIIKSTIAGIKPEDIDIIVNNDMVTIRGERAKEDKVIDENYFFQECYWGGFSRSIILPQEVKADQVKATLENGILTIRLPKEPLIKKVKISVTSSKPIKKKNIKVKEETGDNPLSSETTKDKEEKKGTTKKNKKRGKKK